MNEDFYYIEVWHPPGKRQGKPGVYGWISFGYNNKWTLEQCLASADVRKFAFPRQKLRICRQIVTRTEWRNRKSIKHESK